MADGDVVGGGWFDGEADADDVGFHFVQTGGFQVEADGLAALLSALTSSPNCSWVRTMMVSVGWLGDSMTTSPRCRLDCSTSMLARVRNSRSRNISRHGRPSKSWVTAGFDVEGDGGVGDDCGPVFD